MSRDNIIPVVGGTGGKIPHQIANGTIPPSNDWTDLITWNAITGTSDAASFDIRLYAYSEPHGISFELVATGFAGRGSSSNATSSDLEITSLASSIVESDLSFILRVIRDSDDPKDILRLQVKTNNGIDVNTIFASNLAIPYGSDVNFGSFDAYTATGREVVIQELDVSDWLKNGITSGGTKGMNLTHVSNLDRKASINFETEDVLIQSSGNTVARFADHGVRMSAGEYGSWSESSSNKPFESAGRFPGLSITGRTEADDSTKNPFGDVNLDGSSVSQAGGNIIWRASTAGISGDQNLLVWSSLDVNSQLRIRFTGDGIVTGAALNFTAEFYGTIDLAGIDETWLVRVGSTTGEVIATWNMLGNHDGWKSFEAKYTVLAKDAETNMVDLFITQTTGPASVNSRSGLGRYSMSVSNEEPPLQTNVVAQFDSNYRGILLPRISPVSSIDHTKGVIALNNAESNGPIYHNGDGWSNITVVNNVTALVDYGTYYNSEVGSGLPQDQNFAGDVGWSVVKDHQGFTQLLRAAPNSGTIVLSSTVDDEDEFWEAALRKGLIVTQKVMVANSSAQMHSNIEPRNAATSWPSGRFTWNITEEGNQTKLFVERANGTSDSVSVPFSKNVMHTINVIVPPNSDTATVLLDGHIVATADMAGGYNGERGIFTDFFNGTNRDYYVQQYGIYVMDSASVSHAFTVKEIEDNIRYVIPTNANTFALTMPKHTFPVGTTFSVVNSGVNEVNISGASDDVQLFAGKTTGTIPVGTECTFVQGNYPRGNIWSMSNSTTQKTSTSLGNTLHMKIDGDTSAIVNRHGTYTKKDVTIQRNVIGEYDITIGGHIFTESNFTGLATTWSSPFSDGSAQVGLGAIGTVRVETRVNGAKANKTFSVSIYW